ncbi:SepM family pheromone-processing serine protease [Lactiplantibacillus pentosus]|uniref:PDZ domain-containing protein n=1 Tax=Lactiplantibacillus pentosus TaxID=1589 RepID=A0AB37RF42_LACPE|nr:SepM family pheromone-processing serine protease [Lactiplantibacillus pentosus]RMW41113.1 PDZ domain-containing protein [Lactiplantibacillus pentosus]RMW41369.1 PDZ domain-containing protein [Lactiplantibacillus pentosus]RMW50806.1 PDZ domain-containing protein [Lactiplantibacillus pentosus]RMW51346.1 PDZ domain-containing protein [Lactiplantibacillus pentosus]
MKTVQRLWKRYWGLVLIVVALLVFFLLPLPYYIEGPGSADNLKSFVTVKHHPDKRRGKFMLTSVAEAPATPALWLYAQLNPHYDVVSAEDMTGGQDDATYNRVQKFYMRSAINEAIATAYSAAHQSYRTTYQGIYVLDIQSNSKFKHQLKVGDTITKVDGHHFNTASAYQRYISKQGVGHRVTISYRRNGKTKQATAPLVKLSTHRAGIGITLTDNVKVTTKIPVKVDPGQIGGPSAGLMFSLQIYQQLTNQNLRHGQKIAGTGTINQNGQVGEIGGIDKKVIAAKRAGATIFFAPYVKPTKALLAVEEQGKTNYQLAKATAKKYAPNMKVVPVTSFKQAVHYLQTHSK